MEFKAEPYTLRLSPNSPETEKAFREKLNFSWCNAVLFNVEAIDNRAPIAEYDAILWNEKNKEILFIEYKNSISMYKSMQGKNAQQKKSYAKNVARAFGFRNYNFIIVVNGLEERAEKGTSDVIPLEEMAGFVPKFESTIEELDYVNKLLGKYDREDNPIEPERELLIKELGILRDKIGQVNS
jgi:hypothetical protein